MNNSQTNNSEVESLHKHLNDVVLPELKRKANAGKWNCIDGDNITLYTFYGAPVISCQFISLSDCLVKIALSFGTESIISFSVEATDKLNLISVEASRIGYKIEQELRKIKGLLSYNSLCGYGFENLCLVCKNDMTLSDKISAYEKVLDFLLNEKTDMPIHHSNWKKYKKKTICKVESDAGEISIEKKKQLFDKMRNDNPDFGKIVEQLNLSIKPNEQNDACTKSAMAKNN